MTVYTFARPVPGARIVPFGEPRLATDVLPNGRPAFRVTQRFDDVNPALPNLGAHRATDLGNFNCGDPVYAVYAGYAQTIGPDQYGALGIIVDHGAFSSVYWHLNAFSIPRGDRVPVKWGQQIGIVGKTGIGAVCHLHFEVKVAGVRIDPEPYLFGAPLVLEDSDVNIPDGLKHVAQAVVGARNRLRADPMTSQGSRVLDSAIFVQVYGVGVKGEPYTLGGVPGDEYAWVAAYGRTWYVAQPLLSDWQLTTTGQGLIPETEVVKEVPTGITPEAVTAAVKAATDPLTEKLRLIKEAGVAVQQAGERIVQVAS